MIDFFITIGTLHIGVNIKTVESMLVDPIVESLKMNMYMYINQDRTPAMRSLMILPIFFWWKLVNMTSNWLRVLFPEKIASWMSNLHFQPMYCLVWEFIFW